MRKIILIFAVAATGVIAGCGSSGSTDTGSKLSLPVTPDKLAARIVAQDSGGANPAVSANCDAPTADPTTGAGTYNCDVLFQSGEGFPTVTVKSDGSFSVTGQG